MLLDEAFEAIGGMGKFQIMLMVSIYLMLGWPSPAVTIVFTSIEMDHWCKLDNTTMDKELWIPRDNTTGEYDSCHRYASSDSGTPNTSHLVPCEAWTYDLEPYGPSIVSMYDVVCERRIWLSMVRTSFLLGMMVAAIYCGFISDRFGRKRVLFISWFLSICVWFMGIFAPNILVYSISRFLVGTLRMTVFSCGVLLSMELVGPRWRFFVGITCNIAYTLGYMALAGLAYAFKDSFKMELAIVCSFILHLLFVFLLPESPRFLLASGRKAEAMEVMRMMGRRNGKPLPPSVTSFYMVKGARQQKATIFDLLRSKILRRRLFITSFHWLTLTLLYYMLTLNSQSLIPGNFYLNNFLLAFLEIPAAIIGLALSSWHRVGRRLSVTLSAIAVGVCGFITVPLSIYGYMTTTTVFVMLCKFFVTMCFDVGYIYVGELFPTEVRHVGFGMSNTAGRISGLFAAYLGDFLASLWLPLPYIVFGVMGTISGMLDLLLPETLGQNLSETVEEEEMKCGKQLKFPEPDPLTMELNSGKNDA